MRLAKRSSYISLVLSIISLIGVFCYNQDNQFYDISLAIFGSAILSFIIALLQYVSEKKKVLFEFYKVAQSISNSLSHVEYYNIDERKKDIIESVHNNYPDVLVSDYEFFQNDEQFHRCVESYISILEIELDELKNSYGNMDFLLGNRFLKKRIEKSIYAKLIEAVNYIKQKGNTFKFFLPSGNIIHCLDQILKLNDYMFSKEYNKDGTLIVYNKVYSEISENTERFRCKIHKQKFEKSTYQHIVFMEIIQHIKI